MEMDVIICIALFSSIVLIILGIFFLSRRIWGTEQIEIRKRLQAFSSVQNNEGDQKIDIIWKQRLVSNIPWVNRMLCSIPLLQRIDRLLLQSDFPYPLGVFLLIIGLTAFTGFMFAYMAMKSYAISCVAALLACLIPFLFLHIKKVRKLRKFEQQLPDALEMIARALKAGHAFLGGLMMVAREFNEPIKSEFGQVVDEINFGAGVKDALIRLAGRIDCKDLKFFTVAVAIQRETGGDLAEILENIARLIRDRFKLRDRIQTLSAEGRFSATTLILIPFFLAGTLIIVNPDYIKVLVDDPAGNVLVAVSLLMMISGIFIMKKITAINV